MRTRSVAASLVALLALACRTGPAPRLEPFGPGTEELVEKTGRLTLALLNRDQAELDALLAPEYTFHFIDHGLRGSMQAMPNAPRGKWVLKMLEEVGGAPMQTAIVDARVHGDVGIVVLHYRWSGARLGQGFQYEGYITDIWLRRDGRWQLLAGHASVLTPAP